jgi:RHH-type transcriptional regulator, proline utilization regulon repressor / proline dehydrogenase / delta 1-pyrroline-5-carboxylate dehydrogenase
MYWKNELNYIESTKKLSDFFTADEPVLIEQMLAKIEYFRTQNGSIHQLAREFTVKMREIEQSQKGMTSLVQHYDLSTEEGIVLMCVAEALLRIPDAETENLLIADKLSSGNWEKHLGQGRNSFVNMTTWGLSVSSKILSTEESTGRFKQIWHNMIKKTSEGFIRQAVKRTIKWMSEEFVLGRTIDEALKKGRGFQKQGYTFSFDMLGEAAMTQNDATRYFMTYADAIEKLARHIDEEKTIFQRPGISVKLSALYPRYEFLQQERAVPELTERLKQLAMRARDLNIALTVDAEEAERLDMSLEIFKRVYCDSEFHQWEGLGLAVQAYQKRAGAVCDWVINLAQQNGRRIQLRLVKGAYWDTEIKRAQMQGWNHFPVYSLKSATDVSYLYCAEKILRAQEYVYPKFATHNAYTVAAILKFVDDHSCGNSIEFQNLQGMGKSLHQQILAKGISCRIYAPVGSYKELLPYLVRRLLENGANTSFVNQLANKELSVDELISSPLVQTEALAQKYNKKIPLPRDIFHGRNNSAGFNFSNFSELALMQEQARNFRSSKYQAYPLNQKECSGEAMTTVYNPSYLSDQVGEVFYASDKDVEQAFVRSRAHQKMWRETPVEKRAEILQKFADALEQNRAELVMLLQREAGKVTLDAIDEIREAVDFCRYYALEACIKCVPHEFKGYTGESNIMTMEPRGTVVCISPWNFPVAIFVGQIVAALVVGNTVVAKPAEQTSLLAARVVELLYAVGLPCGVLSVLPGLGDKVGAAIVQHPDVAAVIFTGSTETAHAIQLSLSKKKGPITPVIAETGGLNVMIADSTALLEQLTRDAVTSAFGSAGQRCSALRVLFVQEDIADAAITMISGAMALLNVGTPEHLCSDIGPVIDEEARSQLCDHLRYLDQHAKQLFAGTFSADLEGHYFAPHLYEISDLSILKREVFGPILHVIRFKRSNIERMIDQINAMGYGLTFGIHSRIDSFVKHVTEAVSAGNVYVNRNTIGAVVGLQPFGGCGLSGTGPKAGGPHYLSRLCYEKLVSNDITATGGNATLMTLSSDVVVTT